MSAASIAPESRRLEVWEAEMAEIRAEVEREMENLVTEDDTPVDNILSEKQQRLLTEPLYGAWSGPDQHAPGHRGFLALANVGLFYALRQPPLVPDMMLALDMPGPGPDLSQKANRSYFTWVQDGKPPTVVVEVVSNQEEGEDGDKLRKYEAIGIPTTLFSIPGGCCRIGCCAFIGLPEQAAVISNRSAGCWMRSGWA